MESDFLGPNIFVSGEYFDPVRDAMEYNADDSSQPGGGGPSQPEGGIYDS